MTVSIGPNRLVVTARLLELDMSVPLKTNNLARICLDDQPVSGLQPDIIKAVIRRLIVTKDIQKLAEVVPSGAAGANNIEYFRMLLAERNFREALSDIV